MNWQKANQTLDNLQRLFQLFETSETLLDIEKDLLLRRIQDLYAIVLESNTEKGIKQEQKVVVVEKVKPKQEIPKPAPKVVVEKPVIEQPKPKEQPVVKPVEVVKPPVVEVKKPVIEQAKPKVEVPKYELPKFQLPKPTPPKVKVPEPPKPAPPKVVQEKPAPPKYVEPKKPIIQEPVVTSSGNEEIDALFEYKVATDLSEKLSTSPITNLKNSMSINERFIVISELFKGNNARYSEAIDKLNEFQSFDQAKAYMISNLVSEFDWTNAKKDKVVKAFIKKVRRRYL